MGKHLPNLGLATTGQLRKELSARESMGHTDEDYRTSDLTAAEKINLVAEVAVDPGNAHADHYMRGMANGLILAKSIVDNVEPKYIEGDAVAPAFDYMAEADKTCSIVFGSQHVNTDGMKHLLRGIISYSREMNLIKKLLFRGKVPSDLGLPVPTLHESLAVEWPHNLPQSNVDVIHGIVGVITEAGEAAEVLLTMIESGSGHDFDAVNVAEEAGDLRWYIVRMLRGIGMTDEQCERMNIEKLHGRLGESFDVFRDANRDLVAERAKLEASFTPAPAPLFEDPTERFIGDYRSTADAEAQFIGDRITGSDAIALPPVDHLADTELSGGFDPIGRAGYEARDRAHPGYHDADAPIPPAKAMVGVAKVNAGTQPPGVASVIARTPAGDCEGMDC